MVSRTFHELWRTLLHLRWALLCIEGWLARWQLELWRTLLHLSLRCRCTCPEGCHRFGLCRLRCIGRWLARLHLELWRTLLHLHWDLRCIEGWLARWLLELRRTLLHLSLGFRNCPFPPPLLPWSGPGFARADRPRGRSCTDDLDAVAGLLCLQPCRPRVPWGAVWPHLHRAPSRRACGRGGALRRLQGLALAMASRPNHLFALALTWISPWSADSFSLGLFD